MHKDKAGREVVTVCDRCLSSGCWQGIFMCQDSLNAGTVELPVETLRGLHREHESYWEKKGT